MQQLRRRNAKEHREFRSGAGICQYMTAQRFDIAFSTKEIMREAAGPTTALKDKVKANRALPQRTSAMCTEFPLGGKAGRRYPCDGGCRLGRRTKDKVLNVWRSTGNWPVLHRTSSVSDTGYSCHFPQLNQRPRRSAPDGTNVQNLNSGRTAAAPWPLCDGLDQGAERNIWRCRQCGFNS